MGASPTQAATRRCDQVTVTVTVMITIGYALRFLILLQPSEGTGLGALPSRPATRFSRAADEAFRRDLGQEPPRFEGPAHVSARSADLAAEPIAAGRQATGDVVSGSVPRGSLR